MTTRLVLCFDGTWNKQDDNADPLSRVETNVCRFYESVANGKLPDGSLQKKWYEPGVGTQWFDRVRGGAFGLGLDQKIQEGYQWLAENYPDPDPGGVEVFIVGFSRGAYTARSLVGLIRNCDLLLPENAHRVAEAYALYRQRDPSADTDQAKEFRQRYSRPINIKFLGVWDTVGALGVPLSALQWLNARQYAFHDTELSWIVQNAAHAIAIDEHRVDYQVALWSRPKTAKPDQKVEQRWFIGAHADVGGGYATRHLSDLTLAWMHGKASEAGLVVDAASIPPVTAANCLRGPTDSYEEFIHGVYAETHPRFYRTLQLGTGLNEMLDASVVSRYRADLNYRPKNTGFVIEI